MKNIAWVIAAALLVAAQAGAVDFGGLGNAIKNVGKSAGLPIPGNAPVDGDQIQKAVKLGTSLVEAIDNRLGPLEEFYLGREVGARLLAAYPKRLLQDDPVTQYVSRVGTTLAIASRNPNPYRPYTFVVLDTPEYNAFAAPGGIIFVTTGMLKFVKNEDELAGVLAHEVAHVELRHGMKAVEQEGYMKFANTAKDTAVSEVGGDAELINQLTGPLADKILDTIRNGYSVDQESEADLRSLEICAGVGYDPNSFANVLGRLQSSGIAAGSARYPQERESTARAKLQSMPNAAGIKPLEARSQRFAQALAAMN